MATILIQHTVEDFDKWKAAFDKHAKIRKDAGSKGGTVYRNAEDPNHVTVVLKWDDADNARAFAGSAELREAMQQAGVTSAPTAFFLEKVDKTKV
jgi:heme-degrading monooxygenase HmoA